MVSKNVPDPMPIYQLKVTLRGIKPPIWRRIQVRGDITLFKLHKVLQAAMDWEDYHLHQFIIDETYYAIPSPEDPWPMETKNEKRAKLFLVAPAEKTKFFYEYDFGDSWLHEIMVEKIFDPEKVLEHPICLTGKRSGPPEDCGGIGGYYDFVEAISDPEHPEHESMRDWVGRVYDPEGFDKDKVNRLLNKMK